MAVIINDLEVVTAGQTEDTSRSVPVDQDTQSSSGGQQIKPFEMILILQQQAQRYERIRPH
ncbi:hypothetical protein [uncultured Desulfobacter sp.]|uniref:hypothetical protein n=1 Tax=uncultured Desulfobacter sp. TaxID=240139 RepID=UPI0029F51F15|nr:hypothetical protein [uncultured Desulfobacter sp.]